MLENELEYFNLDGTSQNLSAEVTHGKKILNFLVHQLSWGHPFPYEKDIVIHQNSERSQKYGSQSRIREIRRSWLLCDAYKFLRTCGNWRIRKLLQVRASTLSFKAYDFSVFEAELGDVIPVVHTSIGGTRIIGRLTAGNSVPSLVPVPDN